MNVCLHGKYVKKINKKTMIYQNNCKDNLRTLCVEIPSYKGQRGGVASLESALPNLI